MNPTDIHQFGRRVWFETVNHYIKGKDIKIEKAPILFLLVCHHHKRQTTKSESLRKSNSLIPESKGKRKLMIHHNVSYLHGPTKRKLGCCRTNEG